VAGCKLSAVDVDIDVVVAISNCFSSAIWIVVVGIVVVVFGITEIVLIVSCISIFGSWVLLAGYRWL
jgi:hypothetical protein